MPSLYVNDGQHFSGFVPEVPGLCPAVRFTYRVAGLMAPLRVEYMQSPPGLPAIKAGAKLVAGFLNELEARNDDGTWARVAAGATEVNVEGMHAHVYYALLNAVTGVSAPAAREELAGKSASG
jgi:hypothetical protein